MAKTPEEKAEHKSAQKHAAHNGAPTEGEAAGVRRTGPEVVAPSNRVYVAFPFSQFRLQEPSKELFELSDLVLDLIVAMSEWVPEDQLEELRARARAVRDNLR